jgi:transcriptional regulator with XRE-family HTH domain
MDPSLGERLKGLREAKRWTLEYLAEATGSDKGQISRYEKDTADPGTKSLKALAHALDVRSAYLLGEVEELEELTFPQVAAHESLLRFLRAGSQLTESRQKRYWDVVDLPAAPLTVQGWKDLEELLRRLSGTK